MRRGVNTQPSAASPLLAPSQSASFIKPAGPCGPGRGRTFPARSPGRSVGAEVRGQQRPRSRRHALEVRAGVERRKAAALQQALPARELWRGVSGSAAARTAAAALGPRREVGSRKRLGRPF